MPSKYLDQVNVRLPPELKRELEDVCDYERIKVPDLLRQLVREVVREHRKMRDYLSWRRKREEERKA